jgi:hypothetical protein
MGYIIGGLSIVALALILRYRENASALLPTPTKHLSKEGGYPGEYLRNTPLLTAQIVGGGKGFIDGDFTEWMMGFPKGHTISGTE